MNEVTPATAPAYKYDVAFSCLGEHTRLAERFETALQPLRCFVFTTRQREIAGKNGPNAFSQVFKKDSRIAVILHSEGYGTRGYTDLEQMAIQDLVLECGWDRLVLVKLDASEPPVWFPRRVQMYVDLPRFGFDEAVGVIRQQAAAAGANLRRETALERERRLADERDAERRREARLATEGLEASCEERGNLFSAVTRKLEEIRASVHDLTFEWASDAQCIVARAPFASGLVWWDQRYVNSTKGAKLKVQIYRDLLNLPKGGNVSWSVTTDNGPVVSSLYELALSPTDEWGWADKDRRFVSSDDLAELFVATFFEWARRPKPSADAYPRRRGPMPGSWMDWKNRRY